MATPLSSLRLSAGLDASDFTRGAQQINSANASIAASSQASARALAAQDAANLGVANSFIRLSKSFVDGYASAANFEGALRRIASAVERGMGLDRAEAQLQGVYSKFGLVASEATLADQKLSALAPTLNKLNDEFAKVHAAEKIAAQSAAIQDLQSKYAPLIAAERQHAQALAEINKLANAGGFQNETQRAEAVNRVTQAHRAQVFAIQQNDAALAKMGATGGLTAYQMQNLGFQVNDVVTGLASGQPIFQIATQQMGQIYQILQSAGGGVSGAVAGITQYIRSFSPLVPVLGAVGAAAFTMGAAFFSAVSRQGQLERSLSGLGRASGASKDQINKLSEEMSSSGRISTATAREISQEFLQTGRIGTDMFVGLGGIIKDFAATTGKDIPEATKAIAELFGGDIVKGAQELQKTLGGISANQIQNIRNAASQNTPAGRSQAQQLLKNVVTPALADADQTANAFTKLFERLKNEMVSGYDAAGRWINRMSSTTPRQEMEKLVKEWQNLVDIQSKSRGFAIALPGETSRGQAPVSGSSAPSYQNAYNAQENIRRSQQLPVVSPQGIERARISGEASGIARQEFPDIDKQTELQGKISTLKQNLGGDQSLIPPSEIAEQIEALKRYESQLKQIVEAGGALGLQQKRSAQDFQLEREQIYALTPALQAAVAAKQAYITTMRAGLGEEKANLEATRARQLAQDRLNVTELKAEATHQATVQGIMAVTVAEKAEAAASAAAAAAIGTGADAAAAAGRAREQVYAQAEAASISMTNANKDEMEWQKALTAAVGDNSDRRRIQLAGLKEEIAARREGRESHAQELQDLEREHIKRERLVEDLKEDIRYRREEQEIMNNPFSGASSSVAAGSFGFGQSSKTAPGSGSGNSSFTFEREGDKMIARMAAIRQDERQDAVKKQQEFIQQQQKAAQDSQLSDLESAIKSAISDAQSKIDQAENKSDSSSSATQGTPRSPFYKSPNPWDEQNPDLFYNAKTGYDVGKNEFAQTWDEMVDIGEQTANNTTQVANDTAQIVANGQATIANLQSILNAAYAQASQGSLLPSQIANSITQALNSSGQGSITEKVNETSFSKILESQASQQQLQLEALQKAAEGPVTIAGKTFQSNTGNSPSGRNIFGAGFASGGYIGPSGSGSSDSRPISIMTRPDEEIFIVPPEKKKKGGASAASNNLVQYNTINLLAPPMGDVRETQQNMNWMQMQTARELGYMAGRA